MLNYLDNLFTLIYIISFYGYSYGYGS